MIDTTHSRAQRARERRNAAQLLRAAGMPIEEIARRLDVSPTTARDYLWQERQEERARGGRTPEEGADSRICLAEKAEMMSEMYDDDARRRWIWRQMGLEYPDAD